MKETTKKLTWSAMFIALGLVLPFLTGQIPQFGNMLLPMHIPVILCGLICGWRYGAIVGFVLPLLRYALFGMPVLFPTGIAMSFELAAYGFFSGFLYEKVALAVYYRSVPFINCFHDSRKSHMGDCGSNSPGSDGQLFHLANVPCRRISQCDSGHHRSTDSDSSHHGCT